MKRPNLQKVEEQLDQFAWLMDNCIKIPGVNWRIGLEALIGLIPGMGDILGSALGLFLLLRAVQFRLPVVIIVRMAFNNSIEMLIGMIPVIGDLFDFIFKANTLNLKLFRQYAEEPETSTLRHWIIILGLIGGFLLTGALALIFFVWLLYRLFQG